MSYSFGMCFAKAKDKLEMYDFTHKFVKTYYENAKEVLELEKHYIPTYRNEIGDVVYRPKQVDQMWLYSLFHIRFIYWEEYELVGVVGYNYPQACLDMIENRVHFQNSCDQNYPYSDWGTTIPFFADLVDEYENLDEDEFLERCTRYTQDDIDGDLEYYKRSALYDEIYRTLHLDNWINGEMNGFLSFAISAIDSQEKFYELCRLLRIQMHKMKEENEKEEKEWLEKHQNDKKESAN